MNSPPARPSWSFTERAAARYAERYWRCPRRLVTGGAWAGLWRTRCPAATTVLPVLALHVWPEMEGAEPGWTGWWEISQRGLALLAGVSRTTAVLALEVLRETGLAELRTEPSTRGGSRTLYRLHAGLFAQGVEEYARFPASLVYGGTWHIMPNPAARNLYVVIACLDPVGDELAYLQRVAEDDGGSIEDAALLLLDRAGYEPTFGPDDYNDPQEYLADLASLALEGRRLAGVVSAGTLARLSGLADRKGVRRTLALLTAPPPAGTTVAGCRLPRRPLVLTGRDDVWHPDPRASSWYAPSRVIHTYPPSILNDPAAVDRVRRALWPSLLPGREP